LALPESVLPVAEGFAELTKTEVVVPEESRALTIAEFIVSEVTVAALLEVVDEPSVAFAPFILPANSVSMGRLGGDACMMAPV
jgi:hypothetical protein